MATTYIGTYCSRRAAGWSVALSLALGGPGLALGQSPAVLTPAVPGLASGPVPAVPPVAAMPASAASGGAAMLPIPASLPAAALAPVDPFAPILLPLAQLEASLPHDARLAYFVITDQPGLHVLHTPSVQDGGLMFSRIVALLERRDMPRERISTDAEIDAHAQRFHTDPADLTAGNNFTTAELARFFDLARHDHTELKPAERHLRALLKAWGLIYEAGDDTWQPVSDKDFLITIPGLGPMPGGGTMDARLRAGILEHELGHWRFFSDRAYARACRAFWWDDLSYRERTELTRQLANVGYDPVEHIMIDETQAYLLHTPAAYIPFADITWPHPLDIDDVRRRLAARVGP